MPIVYFMYEHFISLMSLQVKPDYDETVHSESFQIVKAVKNKILGQHAGELLLDLKMSVLAEIGAIFGIICMRTNVCTLYFL